MSVKEANAANRAVIAIVEDDDSIRELMEFNLKENGFMVEAFFSSEQIERNFDPIRYDLILLDLMLPGKSGFQFIDFLREKNVVIPVLIISAIDQESKISEAYRLGVIDYIVKPFEMELLLLKVKNLLYHFVKRMTAPLPEKIGVAEIDWDLMQISARGSFFHLTPKEAQALTYFIENPDRIISRKELIEHIWGPDVYVSGRNVDNFLVKFRRIFEHDAGSPSIFLTFPKKGYAYKRPS